MKLFVTLGTHPKSFERLVKALDALMGEGKIKAKVFAQIGSTAKTYRPKNFEFRELITPKELESRVKAADLVISHGGAGSIITALRQGKKLIVVPRRKKFDEHTDDHQIELCEALARERKSLCLKDEARLEELINQSKKFKFNRCRGTNKIGQRIDEALTAWGL